MHLIFLSYLQQQESIRVLCQAGKKVLQKKMDHQSDKVSHISYTTVGQHLLVCLIHDDNQGLHAGTRLV